MEVPIDLREVELNCQISGIAEMTAALRLLKGDIYEAVTISPLAWLFRSWLVCRVRRAEVDVRFQPANFRVRLVPFLHAPANAGQLSGAIV